jgi:hypothetical protein
MSLYYGYAQPAENYVDTDGNVVTLQAPVQTPPGGEFPIDIASVAPHHVEPAFNPQIDEQITEEGINGNKFEGYVDEWVMPSNPGIPNLGPVNQQAPLGGHSSSQVLDPSLEQGYGMDLATVLPRYPHVEGANPFHGQYLQKRGGSWAVTDPSSETSLLQAQTQQGQKSALQWKNIIGRREHGVVVPVPATVPYSANASQQTILSTMNNLMPEQLNDY